MNNYVVFEQMRKLIDILDSLDFSNPESLKDIGIDVYLLYQSIQNSAIHLIRAVEIIKGKKIDPLILVRNIPLNEC